jgi:hypothetical protein
VDGALVGAGSLWPQKVKWLQLTVTTLLQNICQNVGLYENYLLCTSVVFLGGKVFWKKNIL